VSKVVVPDSSALFAVLADNGSHGQWAADQLHGATLSAPHLVLFETANIIRRHQATGLLDPTAAAMAHDELLSLDIDLWPYAALANRAWELRNELTSYDASYIALAEVMNAAFITLDIRTSRATGPRCPVLTPPPR
jgi:predicted nucleic acid-binding protein